MERLTKKENNHFILNETTIEPAIDKLGRFEDMVDALIKKQQELETELELLRKEDKSHTVKFREALGQKFTNLRLISFLQSYKLTDYKIED